MKRASVLIFTMILCTIMSSCSDSAVSVPATPSSAISDGSTYALQSEPPSETTAIFDNVKVSAVNVTVYKAMDKYGDTLGEEPYGKVFKVLETKTDDEGREWYRIYSDFGAEGWITGINCKMTDEKCSNETLTALLDSCDTSITFNITGNTFSLDVSVDNFNLSQQAELPERVLCDTDDMPDKNNLLSKDIKWRVIEGDGLKFVSVRCTVNLVMLEYLWNSFPEFSSMYGSELKNDLARVVVHAEYQGDALKILDVSCVMKYGDPSLLDVEPILDEDLGLSDGPALGMTMQEAAHVLGLYYEDYADLPGIEIGGLTVYLNGSETVGSIDIDSDIYVTTRGLKVGDTIETVEKLYGKPDVGFSGDDSVTYQASMLVDGQLAINDFDTMTVYYKEGIVSGFSFRRMYLH